MKPFAILTFVLAAASLHAASYEARTPRHAVALEVVTLGVGDLRFDVTVTELPSGHVLTVARMPAKSGSAADTEVDVADQHLRIHAALFGTNVMCSLDIEKGDTVVDSIRGVWSTGPALRAPFRVGGDVKAPVVIQRTEPGYTEEARKARVSGIVIAELVIDRTGTVKDVRILKPLPFGLSESATDAIRKWTFRPGTLNGRPVDVIFNVTVNFNLDTPPSPSPR